MAWIPTGGSSSSSWSDYAPTLTATTTNPTVGNGVLDGRYTQNGKLVHAQIVFQFGSTSNAGSGVWEISLPVAADVANGITTNGVGPPVGPVLLFDTGTRRYVGTAVVLSSSGTKFWMYAEGGNAVQHNSPFAWVSGDGLLVNLTYEAA